jgi:5-amino-6-(5-phosphoribosylamino)uracil reductase
MYNEIPYVTLYSTMSLDGYIDSTDERHREQLSSEKELLYRNEIRERVDAVLIGRATLKRDVARISLYRREQCKILLNRRGDVELDGFFFEDEHLVHIYTGNMKFKLENDRRAKEMGVEIHQIDQRRLTILTILHDLWKRRGIKSLLVEGGAQITNGFLVSRAFHELQLGIVPALYGERGGTRLFDSLKLSTLYRSNQLKLLECREFENITLMRMVQNLE